MTFGEVDIGLVDLGVLVKFYKKLNIRHNNLLVYLHNGCELWLSSEDMFCLHDLGIRNLGIIPRGTSSLIIPRSALDREGYELNTDPELLYKHKCTHITQQYLRTIIDDRYIVEKVEPEKEEDEEYATALNEGEDGPLKRILF